MAEIIRDQIDPNSATVIIVKIDENKEIGRKDYSEIYPKSISHEGVEASKLN